MILPELPWGFRLFLCILACYRLAKLISEDDGPLFVFKRIRYWAKDRAWFEAEENHAIIHNDVVNGEVSDRWFGHWHSLAEGLECPYCVGLWLSVPLFLMLSFPFWWGDVFLVFISISAGAAILQGLKR